MAKIKDKTGERFGNLYVLEHIGFNKIGNALFKCLCDCGNECEVPGGHLRHIKPHTISCGCVKFMNRYMHRGFHIDISGKKYGKLTVIEEKVLEFDRNLGHLYECKCDCGNQCFIRNGELRDHGKRKSTQSCGCVLTESSKQTIQIAKKYNPRNNKEIYAT